MTTPDDRHPALPPRPPRSPAVVRRVRRVLVGATAAVGLGMAGTAAAVLTSGSSDLARPATTAPGPDAALVGAGAGPDAAAPDPQLATVLPAQTVPLADDPDTGGPGLVDAAGVPLSPVAAERLRAAYAALGAGDTAAFEEVYAPRPGSAPWPAVEGMLADAGIRAGLQEALRTAPGTRPGLAHVYERDGYRIGVEDDGRIRFVRSP